MPTILVVDDSAVDRRLVGGLLEKVATFTVQYAANGRDAMSQFNVCDPDLVVTDLIMPEMDGLELVGNVVSQHPLVPVILMTGKGSEEIAVKALRAGAASYVPKSELNNLLVQTVNDVLTVARGDRSQARLMDCMVRNECTFVLKNDESMIPPLINYLHRCVRSVGLCDETNSVRVCVALEEALRNALHHGNLELASSLREQDNNKYLDLYEERRIAAPYKDRRISVEINVTPESGSFTIRDDGPGFDPRELPDPTDPANLEKSTGRGLLLMRTFMDDVAFNDIGNQVTMVKRCKASSNGSK
ncbi:MAG: CheY-like chemotaxis protein/anti-sigma regulatory factor (Ser/Thr protein kinase) [Pirellulaceae bacterium]|jgi:CheY-like chemotaxis protein/anti-sigma regulatory factor (Ser/Thr protein kinase)